MDYPTFGIPWTVFTQFNDSRRTTSCYVDDDVDSGSVGSFNSPPPSPMSPSPSLASNEEDSSSFHFLPASKSGGLCHGVPVLLGLQQHQGSNGSSRAGSLKSASSSSTSSIHHGRPSSSSSSSAPSPSSNNGFYKRLLEWLSRKKKSHRRFSEVVLPEHCPIDPLCKRPGLHGLISSSGRNQSAPMIFDIVPPNHPRIKVADVDDEHGHVDDDEESAFQHAPGSSSSRNDDGHGGQNQQRTQDGELDSLNALPPAVTPTTPTTPTFMGEIDAEWIIPWSDIQVGEVIARRGDCTINRGRWHGDVILHQFDLQSTAQVSSFWAEVETLSKLRHENLLLFMGIATKGLSAFTIVNSAPRGVSVANFRLGVKNGKPERIGMRAAVSIARQVAQATGYLHARGIVHGKLNPHNIFLEGDHYRVKLSLLDHGQIETAALLINYGCVPKMHLSYYSPELIRSIVIRPPELHFSAESTKYSDVYALGSFMYDLIAGSPPFHQEETDSILWRIGSGQTTQLVDTKCNDRLKALMASCWSYDALQRPSCAEVVRRLQPSALLCKSHSCSEPERLNRLGTCKLQV